MLLALLGHSCLSCIQLSNLAKPTTVNYIDIRLEIELLKQLIFLPKDYLRYYEKLTTVWSLF